MESEISVRRVERPEPDSAWYGGEPARNWRSLNEQIPNRTPKRKLRVGALKSLALRLHVKAAVGPYRVFGGRNDRKVVRVNRGDLSVHRVGVHALVAEEPTRSGVRARIVAMKPGNSGGAKAWAGRWMCDV